MLTISLKYILTFSALFRSIRISLEIDQQKWHFVQEALVSENGKLGETGTKMGLFHNGLIVKGR